MDIHPSAPPVVQIETPSSAAAETPDDVDNLTYYCPRCNRQITLFVRPCDRAALVFVLLECPDLDCDGEVRVTFQATPKRLRRIERNREALRKLA